MTNLSRNLRTLVYFLFLRWLPNSNIPGGFIFDKMRTYWCRPLFRKCGSVKGMQIQRNVNFGNGRMLTLGDNAGLGTNCYMVGDIIIGNDISMSFDVFISSMNRDFSDTEILIPAAGNRPDAPVVIGDDVLLLARVVILAGVTIGSHVVVGACSVVSKDVPSYCVVAGNPARIVTWRREPDPNYDPKTMTPLSDKLQKRYDEQQA